MRTSAFASVACHAGKSILLLAVALGISACGSQVSPASAPVTSEATAVPGSLVVTPPSAAPSPTPDPAALLLAALADPHRQWRVAIEGTESVPSGISVVSGDGTPMPVGSLAPLVLRSEGEAWVVGSDFVLRLQVVDQPNLVINELRMGPELQRRDHTHPWQVLPPADDTAPLRFFDLLGSLTSLEPAGEATVDGAALLRYRVPASTGLGLVTLYLQEEALKKPDSGTVELLARSDGTPVQATVHMTSDDFDYSEALPSGMAVPPRTYDFTYTFEPATDLVLPDPTAAVTRFKSRSGLSLELPADWEADTTEDRADVVFLPGGQRLVVILRYSPKDLPEAPKGAAKELDSWARFLTDDIQTEATIETIETTTVAGMPGYVIAARTAPGAEEPMFRLEAAFVDGSSMYSIFQLTPPGTELRDRYDFDRMLLSVKLDN